MITNEQVIKRFEKEVEELNENFSNYEKIKRFELLSEPLSIDAGELTPTLKLKRRNILSKYNHLYQKIYV